MEFQIPRLFPTLLDPNDRTLVSFNRQEEAVMVVCGPGGGPG